MSSPHHPVSAHDLIAYLDGELDGARIRFLDDELRKDAVLADQIADWRHQNELLHAAFDPIAARSMPRELINALPSAPTRLSPKRRKSDRPTECTPPLQAHTAPPHARSALGMAIALTLAFLGGAVFVGLTGASWTHGRSTGPQLVQLAAPIFPDAGRRMALRALETRATYQGLFADAAPSKGGTNLALRPRGDVDKASADAWLNAILRLDAGTPNLNDLGLTLVSTRLTPAEQGPAVWLVYAASGGASPHDRAVSLFVTRIAAPDAAPRYEQDAQAATIYWTNAGLGFAVTGPREQDELASVANALRQTWGPAR